MSKEDDPKTAERPEFHLARPTTSDLRGRQSVRATFKLTETCIDAISIVATHLGIKQKSLFDHLVEDTQSLLSIAEEVSGLKLRARNRVQKTFVISRKSLVSLDEIAKSFNAPRDALVEYSVHRLLPIINSERKRHRIRKQIQSKMDLHFEQGKELLISARKSLGEEDPIVQKLESVLLYYSGAKIHIDAFIEKGSIIEAFESSDLDREIE